MLVSAKEAKGNWSLWLVCVTNPSLQGGLELPLLPYLA